MKKGLWRKALILTLVPTLVFLAACSGPKVTPTEVMDQALKALQEKKTDVFGQTLGYDEDTYEVVREEVKASMQEGEDGMTDEAAYAFTDALLKRTHDFKYEILEENVDGETATVKLKLTCADIDAVNKQIEEEGRAESFREEHKEELKSLSQDEKANRIFIEYSKWIEEADHTFDREVTLNMVYDKDLKSWVLPEEDYDILTTVLLEDIVK